MLAGLCEKVSQMDGPLPSASKAPSIWKALVATPQVKVSGKRMESVMMLRMFEIDFIVLRACPAVKLNVEPAGQVWRAFHGLFQKTFSDCHTDHLYFDAQPAARPGHRTHFETPRMKKDSSSSTSS